jgi:sugar/nucleoside kinase (ribokinase family)
MTPEIVIIGHTIHETIRFPDRTIEPVLGSPVAYSSVIAGVLGAPVGIVTKIGQDMPPELLQPFAAAGVDTRGVRVAGPHSTRNLLIYDVTGNKQVQYLRKAPDIFFDDIPVEYRGARLFFVCPMDYEVPLETVQAIRALPANTIVVDLGGYGGATSDTHPSLDERRDPAALRSLIRHVDIVKASIEDCRHIVEHTDEEALGRLFVSWGAQVGMVTLGERGAIAVTPDTVYRIPAFPSRAVDATGAGDAFSAGFLVEYLWTGDVERAARFGCATAALVIEGTGGVLASRMPTADAVYSRVAGGSGSG